MTIKVTKPSINLREKLSELDFDKVPFQKMPAGSVVQMETFVLPYSGATNESETTSTSYQATIFEITITPKFINSKILIMVNPNVKQQSGVSNYHQIAMFRSIDGASFSNLTSSYLVRHKDTDSQDKYGRSAIDYVDTPDTTLSVTYKLYQKLGGSGGTIRIGENSATETMIAMEIKQ